MSNCDLYTPDIYAAADAYGIDRGIALAQIRQESGCNPNACSAKKACGIAQFMPATAARFGVDVHNVASSLDGWGRYMRFLLDKFGTYALALAGYNAGEGAVQRARGIPPYPETQNYVRVILANAGSVPTTTGGQPGEVPVSFRPYRILRSHGSTDSSLGVGGSSKIRTLTCGGSAYRHAHCS
jgi:hypothetical protein